MRTQIYNQQRQLEISKNPSPNFSVPSGRRYCSAGFQPWVHKRLFSIPKSRRDDVIKGKVSKLRDFCFLYIGSSLNFDISQSHRDDVIVAQGFNPGFIEDC